MKLIFKTEIPVGSAIPLPVGWPAVDHDEPDEELAREKISSGHYRADAPPKRNQPAEGEEDD